MSAVALSVIARLREAGAMLECKDGRRVRFSARTPLPAALLAEAREHREAIAAALTADAHGPPSAGADTNEWGFTLAERAAVLARPRFQQSQASPAAHAPDALPAALQVSLSRHFATGSRACLAGIRQGPSAVPCYARWGLDQDYPYLALPPASRGGGGEGGAETAGLAPIRGDAVKSRLFASPAVGAGAPAQHSVRRRAGNVRPCTSRLLAARLGRRFPADRVRCARRRAGSSLTTPTGMQLHQSQQQGDHYERGNGA